jgi:hypothetical protein
MKTLEALESIKFDHSTRGFAVVKRPITEARSVYLSLDLDVHRILRHLAAERDVSLSVLLKGVINDFIATTSWSQQPVAGDFPETIPPGMSNGAEFAGDLMESLDAPSGG